MRAPQAARAAEAAMASIFCELSARHWLPLKNLGRHKLPWRTFAVASSHAALGEAQSIQGFSGGGSIKSSAAFAIRDAWSKGEAFSRARYRPLNLGSSKIHMRT